jgi:hypothetical protein
MIRSSLLFLLALCLFLPLPACDLGEENNPVDDDDASDDDDATDDDDSSGDDDDSSGDDDDDDSSGDDDDSASSVALFSGTVTIDQQTGPTGLSPLDAIMGNTLGWEMRVTNPSFEYHEESRGFGTQYKTTLLGDSFEFEFSGPDAALLNTEICSQITRGGFQGGAVFEAVSDSITGQSAAVYVWPNSTLNGVYLEIPVEHTFPLDASGYPVVTGFTNSRSLMMIRDSRFDTGRNNLIFYANSTWDLGLMSHTP